MEQEKKSSLRCTMKFLPTIKAENGRRQPPCVTSAGAGLGKLKMLLCAGLRRIMQHKQQLGTINVCERIGTHKSRTRIAYMYTLYKK